MRERLAIAFFLTCVLCALGETVPIPAFYAYLNASMNIYHWFMDSGFDSRTAAGIAIIGAPPAIFGTLFGLVFALTFFFDDRPKSTE